MSPLHLKPSIAVRKYNLLNIAYLLSFFSFSFIPHPRIFFFHFLRFYVFIFRESGREGKRERNTDVRNIDWLPLMRAPTWDWTCNLSLCGMTLNPLSHTGQGHPVIFSSSPHWTTSNCLSIPLLLPLKLCTCCHLCLWHSSSTFQLANSCSYFRSGLKHNLLQKTFSRSGVSNSFSPGATSASRLPSKGRM